MTNDCKIHKDPCECLRMELVNYVDRANLMDEDCVYLSDLMLRVEKEAYERGVMDGYGKIVDMEMAAKYYEEFFNKPNHE